MRTVSLSLIALSFLTQAGCGSNGFGDKLLQEQIDALNAEAERIENSHPADWKKWVENSTETLHAFGKKTAEFEDRWKALHLSEEETKRLEKRYRDQLEKARQRLDKAHRNGLERMTKSKS